MNSIIQNTPCPSLPGNGTQTKLRILAVIAARGGSKGIRFKNIQLLNGKPLIHYILGTAGSTQLIDDVIVSSDSEEILEYSSSFATITRLRPAELAGDDVTLDPVIYDAVTHAEEQTGKTYDVVVTLQATSPTLRPDTLHQALTSFISNGCDTCISVVDDNHIKWQLNKDVAIPLYSQRLNRQFLPKTYRETGSFLITRREFITRHSRIGPKIKLYPLPQDESVDIDSPIDWIIAQSMLSIRKVAFIVRGNKTVGLGHIYNSLALADSLLGHSVVFYTYCSDAVAPEIIRNAGYHATPVDDKEWLLKSLADHHPDIVITDILDTSREFIARIKSTGAFAVTFEDLGEGGNEAHLVFNPLYDFSSVPEHHRFGPSYVCLPRSIMLAKPIPFRDTASTLLATFGGVDENNLVLRTSSLIPEFVQQLHFETVILVLGPAYSQKGELSVLLEGLEPSVRSRVKVYEHVSNMGRVLGMADVAITSNGRTVYELAAMGVPTISIAQNDRETLHSLARYSKGIIYLGLAPIVARETILQAVKEVSLNTDLRAVMHKTLLSYDLRGGLNRVKSEILAGYREWKDAKHQVR